MAIFAKGHQQQLPRLTSDTFRYKTFMADLLKKSIQYAANTPMKQTVVR